MTISNERLRAIQTNMSSATAAEARDMAARVLDLQDREQTHAREWRDSIEQHEQKRDEEARLRDGLERRAEDAEAALLRVRDVGHNDDCLFCGFKDREVARLLGLERTAVLPTDGQVNP